MEMQRTQNNQNSLEKEIGIQNLESYSNIEYVVQVKGKAYRSVI
jgi:hypothetical protein